MPDPKRDESRLPRVWVDVDQNGLRLATSEEYGAAPYKGWFFLSLKYDRMMPIGWRQVEYCPVNDLEAAQRRIAELEKAAGDCLHDFQVSYNGGSDKLEQSLEALERIL